MPFHKSKRRKNSLRLQGWDYSRPGAYFVTVNVKGRVCFFGKVKDEQVVLSDVGKMADSELFKLPEHFPYLYIDEYIVMPNHIHAILFIMQNVLSIRRDVHMNVPTSDPNKSEYHQKISPKNGSVSVVIRTYKAAVKTWCNINGYGDFDWQARFNDRVIRSNEEVKKIRQYIIDNPKNWDGDENNPLNVNRI